MTSICGNETGIYMTWSGTVNWPIKDGGSEHMGERGLYRIIAVDPETEDILIDNLVVAKDEATARVKGLTNPFSPGIDFDDLDFIVIRLGSVRAKRRP